MTIWYIFCLFGNFLRIWYYVRTKKIWQPWAEHENLKTKEMEVSFS
jgi:hypothetical protein